MPAAGVDVSRHRERLNSEVEMFKAMFGARKFAEVYAANGIFYSFCSFLLT